MRDLQTIIRQNEEAIRKHQEQVNKKEEKALYLDLLEAASYLIRASDNGDPLQEWRVGSLREAVISLENFKKTS